MKAIVCLISVSVALSATAMAQSSPSPSSASSPASNSTAPAARTDVYRVYFGKAAPGKAAQLAQMLKTPDPQAAMPGHSVVLRHQEGDSWDYCAIQHYGTKATIDATPFQVPANMRDVTDWHTDTFVNGPSWTEFTKAMGMSDDGKTKSAGSVYVVSVYRPAPGRREDMEKFLGEAPSRPSDTTAANVLMQHLEGGPWTFFTIARYNSWQDFATNDMNSAAQTAKGQGGWFKLREVSAFHTDTLADLLQ